MFGTGLMGACSLCRVKVRMKLVPGSSRTSCAPTGPAPHQLQTREGSCVDWLKVMAVTPGCLMASTVQGNAPQICCSGSRGDVLGLHVTYSISPVFLVSVTLDCPSRLRGVSKIKSWS